MFKIGWQYYVIEKKGEVRDAEGDFCFGLFDPLDRRIVINTDMDQRRQQETTIHEILHAIDETYSIGLSELTIMRLSSAMTSLVDDNSTELYDILKERKEAIDKVLNSI